MQASVGRAPGKRSSILRRYTVEAFSEIDEMSMTYYALDPSAFAVKAYRHYLTLSDPAQFLADLLADAVKPLDYSVESR